MFPHLSDLCCVRVQDGRHTVGQTIEAPRLIRFRSEQFPRYAKVSAGRKLLLQRDPEGLESRPGNRAGDALRNQTPKGLIKAGHFCWLQPQALVQRRTAQRTRPGSTHYSVGAWRPYDSSLRREGVGRFRSLGERSRAKILGKHKVIISKPDTELKWVPNAPALVTVEADSLEVRFKALIRGGVGQDAAEWERKFQQVARS